MSWLDTLEDIRKKDFGKATAAERDKASKDVVNLCSYACAAVSVSPIPFSDVVVMLPIQSAMVITVGHIYGRKLTGADARDLVMELGATFGAGMLARQGIKAMLPIFGALLTIPAAFAANWAMGKVAIEYFRVPGSTKERLRQVYKDAKAEGASLFSTERFNRFRKGVKTAPEAPAPTGRKKPAAKARPKKKSPKKSKVGTVVEGDFAARLDEHPEVAEAIAGCVHLDITGAGGGQWTADLREAPGEIVKGFTGEPKLTITASADDFLGLVRGEQDVQGAVLSGALSLEPMNLELAGHLGALFS